MQLSSNLQSDEQTCMLLLLDKRHQMHHVECRWKNVVENHLAGQLDSYVVHDNHDLDMFRRICMQFGIKMPRITVGSFTVPQHSIPDRHRPSGVPSLMDVLHCSDNKLAQVVLNNVIDAVSCMLKCMLLCMSLLSANWVQWLQMPYFLTIS